MHKGTIKKLLQDRGFGFISDTDGREIFFHYKSLTEAKFADLKEGQELEYEVEDSNKGPRAIQIKVSGT